MIVTLEIRNLIDHEYPFTLQGFPSRSWKILHTTLQLNTQTLDSLKSFFPSSFTQAVNVRNKFSTTCERFNKIITFSLPYAH